MCDFYFFVYLQVKYSLQNENHVEISYSLAVRGDRSAYYLDTIRPFYRH